MISQYTDQTQQIGVQNAQSAGASNFNNKCQNINKTRHGKSHIPLPPDCDDTVCGIVMIVLERTFVNNLAKPYIHMRIDINLGACYGFADYVNFDVAVDLDIIT